MDHKSGAGPVPPYEPYPGAAQQPQHTGSYNNGAPSAPMSEADMYPTPQHTGTTNHYPHDPMGSPPPAHEQPYGYPVPQGQHQPGQTPPIAHQNSYGIQPSQPPIAHVPTGNEKQGLYPAQAQPSHQGSFHPGQQGQGQYQTAVPIANLGEAAAPVDCPMCHHRALTRVQKHSGNTVHAWAALACICCCLGCIPYLISGLKDVEHYCGNCGMRLAIWKNSGRTVVEAHS